jgi:hypothetical protein
MSGDIATIFDPERMTESLNNLFYPGSTPLGFGSRHFGVYTCAVRLGAPEAWPWRLSSARAR